MPILFISGVNDRSTIGVSLDGAGKPVYLMDGNASIHHRLPLREGIASAYQLYGKDEPHQDQDACLVHKILG